MKKLLIGVILGSVMLMSCQKEKAVESVFVYECVDTISYAGLIVPEIIDMSCNVSGCHDNTNKGDITLKDYTSVSDNADLIYNVISHAPGATQMPIGLGAKKLSDSLIAQFKCWIDQGKLDN
ncbi:MAG: hypothetical protein AB8B74_03335 [Crocinitomicaceae bacterium]